MTPKPRTEVQALTLDQRIEQVELRLIAREERLWRGGLGIRDRVRERLHHRSQQALRLRRLLKPVALVGAACVAAGGLWWVWRRRSRARRAPQVRQAHGLREHPQNTHFRLPRSALRARVVATVGVLNLVPWTTVLNVVWPLLPGRLKRRATPGGAAATLAVALPWVAKFAAPQDALGRQGRLHLWMSTLNGLWQGMVGMKQRAGRQTSPTQTQPRNGS